jgi:hypothetical protein
MTIIDDAVILELLSLYQSQYEADGVDSQHKYYYSKLSLLDLAGWVEQSVDELIRSANHEVADFKDVEKHIIKPINGFGYGSDIRPMLIKSIGLSRVESLENSVDQTKHEYLKSNLGTLKEARNSLAHTYTNLTIRISEPKTTLKMLGHIKTGLANLEGAMRELKLLP